MQLDALCYTRPYAVQCSVHHPFVEGGGGIVIGMDCAQQRGMYSCMGTMTISQFYGSNFVVR